MAKTPKPPKAAPKTSNRGRPRGSRNIARDEVDVIGSRCKRCGSSNRTPYQSDPTTLDYCGTDPITGRPYNQIIWRRTACGDCGQARVDKCYEQRAEPRRPTKRLKPALAEAAPNLPSPQGLRIARAAKR